MDISPSALFRNFLPRLPSIFYTGVLAILGRTPNSSDQDAITQIIVAAARPILTTPAKIGRSQRVWKTLGDWSAWSMDVVGRAGLGDLMGLGGVSVRKYVVRIDDGNRDSNTYGNDGDRKGVSGTTLSVAEAVEFAFSDLRDPKHGSIECPGLEAADVEVEWTTCNLKSDDTSESKQKPVILYLHGGAHCLMDPATHRWTTSTLCQMSSADVCTVRFRLSPQHPFPAALVDAFVTYLDLISGSSSPTNDTISPSKIVLAGDSSGGGLAASLLLLLLTLSRNEICVRFRGIELKIPNPPCTGMALTSPWLDITRSLPSTTQNEKWDLIAPPPRDSASPPFPSDEAWPTIPPRAETYCTADICAHPLVSPLAASSKQWIGSPPVWVCAGWEGFTDEIEVFARRVYQSSTEACVWFQGWEGMPHCFGMMPWNQAGWEAMASWAEFCAQAVKSGTGRREVGHWTRSVSRGKSIRREVNMNDLGCEKQGVGYVRDIALTDEVVDKSMDAGRQWRLSLEYEMVQKWKEFQ